jgi:MFS family permease
MVGLVGLLAVGAAIESPTLAALTPSMVGRENLGKAAAIGQTATSIGMLLGPAIGGFLLGAFGTTVPLYIDAVSFVAIAIAGFALRTRRGGRTVAKPAAADGVQANADAAPAWRFRDDRLIVTLATAFAVVLGAVSLVMVSEIFFVRETLGSTAAMYGVITATWTGGVMLGAWPWSRIKGSDERLVIVLLAALVGCSAVLALCAGVWTVALLVPLYLVGGFFNAALNVITGIVLGRRVPSAVRGRAFGIFGSIANGASLIGYVIAGPLLQVLTPRALIAGAGLLSLAVALAFLVPTLVRGLKGVRSSSTAVSYGGE